MPMWRSPPPFTDILYSTGKETSRKTLVSQAIYHITIHLFSTDIDTIHRATSLNFFNSTQPIH
ncbi:MAG: hypothetical protein WBA57_10365 [Elainellaceae cyanobacterium]